MPISAHGSKIINNFSGLAQLNSICYDAVMEKRLVYITHFDKTRLLNAMSGLEYMAPHLRDLQDDLQFGTILESEEIPSDVITMNSRALLKDLHTKDQVVFDLVFPQDASPEQNKISILTPLGVAMLGYRIGDVIEWKSNSGTRFLEIEEILYQPEAAGDFHL